MSEFPAYWDFKTIGDFASRVRAKNTGGECQDPMTISAIDGLVSQRDYFNKIVASKNTEGYTLLHKNDFAYNKSYSDGYPVGAVRRLKTKDRGIVSPLYICFELDREQIDLHFADYLFDSDWFVQAIYGIAKEGARSHGLLNIGIEEFFSASLPIPPLPEQKKIAEILSGIDKRITASDNLQKYYLLLLDSVSRDSFKIEAGEIKTLGELAEFKSGRAFKSEELSEDGIKVTRISNLHKPNFPYWRYKGEYNPKIVARDGDILFSWAGVANSINVHRYRGEDSLLNQHIYNFKFDDPLIKEWSYWNLRNMLPKLRESIEGGAGQLHLTKGFIQSLHIPILSRSKMDSLSKCFQSIQTLVEAQKKTSIKLLALKNALLSDLLSGRKRVSI